MIDSVGSRVQRARENRGLSQGRISAESGVSAITISRIERGVNREPHSGTLDALARSLGCTVDWLLRGDDSGPEPSESPPAASSAA